MVILVIILFYDLFIINEYESKLFKERKKYKVEED